MIIVLLFLQMRVLKSDFAKYNISDDEEMDDIGMLWAWPLNEF